MRGKGTEKGEEVKGEEWRRGGGREGQGQGGEGAICVGFLLMKYFSSPITQATTDLVSMISAFLLL